MRQNVNNGYGEIVRDPNKVSVIMTNYNCENLIERSIKSVLNQTYRNLELIIVDDNSSDNSLNVIKKIADSDGRIRVFKNLERRGTYWSKNSVIQKTSGSYITMIDSDDYDIPQKIEKQISYFKDQKIVCVTCSNDRKVSEFSNETEKIVFGYPSMMFRYKVFEEIGFYDTVKFGADSEFYDRVLLKYGKKSIIFINEVLQISPRRSEGLTNIVPEGGMIRKEYVKNYQKWHNNTNQFYVDFPQKIRPFPINKESEVEYTDLSNSILIPTKSTKILPVIMCVWRRLEGFEKTIRQLNEQTHKDFKLFVWNNNLELSDKFSEILKLSNFDYELYNSEQNIGGFARFILAKKIRRNPNLMDFCVFIDDDQDFGGEILETFISESRSNTILSQWGWEFVKLQYYGKDARKERNPGETLHYAGTGGMVVDMRVFDSEGLYDCPEKYWFVEDLWLSFYSNKYLNFELLKSAVKMKNGDDIHSLYKVVKDVKGPMLIDLVENYKWEILENEVKKETIFEVKVEKSEKPITIYDTVKIEPAPKPELTKKQINYEKINSIFSTNNPKVIGTIKQVQYKTDLKLNSQTISKIQRPKKGR